MRQNQGSEAVASAYGRNLGTKYGAEDAPAIVMTEGRGRSPLTNIRLFGKCAETTRTSHTRPDALKSGVGGGK
jgi:hypothetical protein